jgi:hypothetical protein
MIYTKAAAITASSIEVHVITGRESRLPQMGNKVYDRFFREFGYIGSLEGFERTLKIPYCLGRVVVHILFFFEE